MCLYFRNIQSKFQVNLLSIEDLTAICSKGCLAKKHQPFNDSAKSAVFAVLRSTPSRHRNRAARAKLSTTFVQKLGEVLAKKCGGSEHVLKHRILKRTVDWVRFWRKIGRIGDAFRAQIFRPRLSTSTTDMRDTSKVSQVPRRGAGVCYGHRPNLLWMIRGMASLTKIVRSTLRQSWNAWTLRDGLDA